MHCECIAHKCTHLERLPHLASHLLLLSPCVLTRHRGKKKYMLRRDVRYIRNSNQVQLESKSKCRPSMLCKESYPMGRTVWFFKMLINLNFRSQFCWRDGKIQLTPKITNHLFTCYLNCICRSNPICLIQQWSVIIVLCSYVQWPSFLVWHRT